MSKIIIVYASLTGNTEEMSEAIEKGVQEAGIEVVRKEAYDASAEELLQYDGIILGAYTWGDGELPDELLDFYEEMCELSLSGKKAAVFGSGDTSYANYCGAVDLLEQKLQELGAEIVHESLKFEYNASDEELKVGKSIGHKIANLLEEV
ncbi:putative flavodoxin-2 [Paenibacillus montaniterrae]|uniref:Flavodoxin n=1 Tax=Paenibacillus montaniterrae TaxID=429341 RepID=A0A919YYU4_9BACL|nr:flavodoxin [Paenibacillus montaniterrae]GIP19263.1 putative flavodoxin-2 [Paenibacillus montaniterrae]